MKVRFINAMREYHALRFLKILDIIMCMEAKIALLKEALKKEVERLVDIAEMESINIDEHLSEHLKEFKVYVVRDLVLALKEKGLEDVIIEYKVLSKSVRISVKLAYELLRDGYDLIEDIDEIAEKIYIIGPLGEFYTVE
ncbi:MAG: hypothetical protein DSY42_01735, partial [Aquifex sp.]